MSGFGDGAIHVVKLAVMSECDDDFGCHTNTEIYGGVYFTDLDEALKVANEAGKLSSVLFAYVDDLRPYVEQEER